MKRGLAIAASGILLCAVPYLAWLNPTGVDVRLAPHYTLPSVQLGIVLVVAFLTGASVILLGLLLQSAGRWLSVRWSGRRSRRDARAEALEHRGQALLWGGDSIQGRALLLRAWRRDSSRRRAVLAVAASYLDDGDAPAAERVLADAVDQHRTDADLLLALADACVRQGDHLGAIHALEQLRIQHPHAARVLIPLRDRYAAAGRWADAAAVQSGYLRTLNQSPLIARERERLVGLEYETALISADPAQRLHALAALVDAHPSFIPAVVSFGEALVAAGRTPEALELWERALRHTPRAVLIECLLRHEAQSEPRSRWQHTLRKLRAPAVHADALQLWQARLHVAAGNAADALKELDAIAQPLRSTAAARQLRAAALRQLGHIDQAVTEYAAIVGDGVAPPYACRGCGRGATSWQARCPHCAAWDTFRAAVEIAPE